VPDGAGADQPGSPTGSEFGDALGMEGGVLGGEVGGVPGGVLGGVLGGTGHNLEPVRQPDRPARLLRQVRPRYPEEAFNKKVQGTVMVEIVIDAEGRVASARVVGPLPGLDAAALEAVRQWVFAPAMHRGKPVASIGLAPITFRIL
jgi:protein TonB